MNFIFESFFQNIKNMIVTKVKNRNEVLEKSKFPFSFLPV